MFKLNADSANLLFKLNAYSAETDLFCGNLFIRGSPYPAELNAIVLFTMVYSDELNARIYLFTMVRQ